MRTLLLIRHGSTAGNLQRRYIGRTDEPLCPEGVAQLAPLVQLRPEADIIFVSPARRTVETAALVFPGRKLLREPGLWETDFGAFEAKTADELWEQSQAYRDWVNGNCLGPVPGGESQDQFKKRVLAAFHRCLERVPEDGTAAFVIHGGCIMAILEALAEPRRSFYDYHVKNGTLVQCTEENGILTLKS